MLIVGSTSDAFAGVGVDGGGTFVRISDGQFLTVGEQIGSKINVMRMTYLDIDKGNIGPFSLTSSNINKQQYLSTSHSPDLCLY